MNISYKYRESLKIQQEKVKALDMNKDFIQTVRNIFLIGGYYFCTTPECINFQKTRKLTCQEGPRYDN